MPKPYKLYLIVLCYFMLPLTVIGQMNSRHGKTLPCNGTIRILFLFIEYDYDVNDSLDPAQPYEPYSKWRKGQLPTWKDSLFDPYETGDFKGKLTQFYSESSFNNFIVLGDYYPALITIKESEVKNLNDPGFNIKTIVEKTNQMGVFKSNSGLQIADFDNWTLTQPGAKKITPSRDSLHKWDHVMLLYRNARNLPNSNGRAVPATLGKLFGYNSDTYSNFGTLSDLPFGICRHEFTHLFLGDNNFHSGGGERNGQGSYWIGVQCMWSVIGAAHASLACCNAWDRERLGWKPPQKNEYVSCLDENNHEVVSTLEDTSGIFTLRDFLTTGDAIKIKLPYLQPYEYEQYLWVENHQGSKHNGTVFDHFVFENEPCVQPATPGLYMYMQVDRSHYNKGNIYNGFADYLHPLPADGLYDIEYDSTFQKNACVNDVLMRPFVRWPSLQNPLTGNHALEIPTRDFNGNQILEYNELGILAIEKTEDFFIKNLAYLGNSAVAFTKKGNSKIGMGTNPSTSNLITAVSNAHPPPFKQNYKEPVFNCRTTYLNGISISILSELPNGAITVQIKHDDFILNKSMRWCADSIVVPLACNTLKPLLLTNKSTLCIDRGLTPTRTTKPIAFKGNKVFTDTSQMVLPPNTAMVIDSSSVLVIDNGSKLFLMAGSTIHLKNGASLVIKNGASLWLNDAQIIAEKGCKIIIHKKQHFHTTGNAYIHTKGKRQLVFK